VLTPITTIITFYGERARVPSSRSSVCWRYTVLVGAGTTRPRRFIGSARPRLRAFVAHARARFFPNEPCAGFSVRRPSARARAGGGPLKLVSLHRRRAQVITSAVAEGRRAIRFICRRSNSDLRPRLIVTVITMVCNRRGFIFIITIIIGERTNERKKKKKKTNNTRRRGRFPRYTRRQTTVCRRFYNVVYRYAGSDRDTAK